MMREMLIGLLHWIESLLQTEEAVKREIQELDGFILAMERQSALVDAEINKACELKPTPPDPPPGHHDPEGPFCAWPKADEAAAQQKAQIDGGLQRQQFLSTTLNMRAVLFDRQLEQQQRLRAFSPQLQHQEFLNGLLGGLSRGPRFP